MPDLTGDVYYAPAGGARPYEKGRVASDDGGAQVVVSRAAGEPVGQPMSYASVDRLVRWLRKQTGISFTVHMFRHSYATALLRRGVSPEVVQRLLGHSSVSVTVDTYSHLGIEDARRDLTAAGFLADAAKEPTA